MNFNRFIVLREISKSIFTFDFQLPYKIVRNLKYFHISLILPKKCMQVGKLDELIFTN